jgi:hypothetical protein
VTHEAKSVELEWTDPESDEERAEREGYHCDDELRGCDPSAPRSACYCDCGPCMRRSGVT